MMEGITNQVTWKRATIALLILQAGTLIGYYQFEYGGDDSVCDSDAFQPGQVEMQVMGDTPPIGQAQNSSIVANSSILRFGFNETVQNGSASLRLSRSETEEVYEHLDRLDGFQEEGLDLWYVDHEGAVIRVVFRCKFLV